MTFGQGEKLSLASQQRACLKSAAFAAYLFLLLALLASEDVAVAFHELAHQQETVNGGNAVADQMGYEFAFAAGLLRSNKIVPKCADLA